MPVYTHMCAVVHSLVHLLAHTLPRSTLTHSLTHTHTHTHTHARAHTSQTHKGMAELGMLPTGFSHKNSHGVPMYALVGQCIFMIALTMMVDSVESLIIYQMVSYCFSQVSVLMV
jgi:amino acid permease